MAIGVNDIIRCSVVWNAGSLVQMVNVHHLKVVARAALDADFYDDIQEKFTEMYLSVVGHVSSIVVHDHIEIFNITDQSSEPWAGRNASLDGTNGGEVLPAQLAAELYFRTSAPRHIGKTFLPVFTEAANANGQLSVAAQADMMTAALNMTVNIPLTNGSELLKVIYDKSAGVGRSIISYAAPFHFRTQRRRRVGVGA